MIHFNSPFLNLPTVEGFEAASPSSLSFEQVRQPSITTRSCRIYILSNTPSPHLLSFVGSQNIWFKTHLCRPCHTVAPYQVLTNMEKLQNEDMRTVLDAVDELRAVGVNNIIALPQIVACGDQSTGKSSLLEALTGIPFPRDTGLCTRFATQFILRRADKVSISVTIIPGPNRNDNERERLEDFGRGKTFDPTKLGELIEEATQVMGLPPLTAKKPKVVRAFSHDVLSIAISGPDRPSLTLVDTPGLIKSKGKYQSLKDIKTIEALVKSYINQDSTILLAVLSATYQHELQQIPSMVTKKAAPRTLGIITKPDGPGADTALEREYIELAQNEVLPLGHGWHVVKNRYV